MNRLDFGCLFGACGPGSAPAEGAGFVEHPAPPAPTPPPKTKRPRAPKVKVDRDLEAAAKATGKTPAALAAEIEAAQESCGCSAGKR